jgi:hypothetical protein
MTWLDRTITRLNGAMAWLNGGIGKIQRGGWRGQSMLPSNSYD